MSGTQPTLIGFFLSPFGAPILIMLAISLGALIWGTLGMQAARTPRRTPRRAARRTSRRTNTSLALSMCVLCATCALAVAALVYAGLRSEASLFDIAALVVFTAFGMVSGAILIGQGLDAIQPPRHANPRF